MGSEQKLSFTQRFGLCFYPLEPRVPGSFTASRTTLGPFCSEDSLESHRPSLDCDMNKK